MPLPEDRAGKELKISLTAAERDAFYGLGPFYYGTEMDLFSRFMNERQTAFLISVFLCVFGIVQLFWMPLLLRSGEANTKLFFSALTTLVLGVYLQGYYNLFDLFTDITNANTMLEYLAFYLLACVMAGYLSTVMEGRMKKMYRAFVVFDLFLVVGALVLHALNIVHFTSFILICYGVSFVEAAPFLFGSIRRWRRGGKKYFDRIEGIADRILETGFLFYVIGSFTDAVIFSYVKFTGGQEATVMVPFVTAGSLLFSMAICLHYFLHGVVNLRSEATRRTLQSKAYSDPLTGLSNRGECEQVMERLDRERVRFVVISMDLDHLKEVNDSMGHDAGDRMLRGFSEVLREAFAGCELIGRMGGDEFVVILTGDDCDSADARTRRMEQLLMQHNQRQQAFQYSVSYGISSRGAGVATRRAYDIYLLADERMYGMKRARHLAGAAQGKGGSDETI